MAISVFPAGGGEFVTNDFVLDFADSSNNTFTFQRSFSSGAYNFAFAGATPSFDMYLINSDGAAVGYVNDSASTIVADEEFETIVILGASSTDVITFSFAGPVSNPTSSGTTTGAGAYLESLNPSDLPNIDDTTSVTGGNFASDVEFYFESGTVSIAAKQVAIANSTSVIITRPDNLNPDLDPWDVRVENPGVPEPTGTNANILAGTVDAGASPVWVTTSPLDTGFANQAYSQTLEATDADGAVTYAITAGTLQAGLSLDSSTGVISGTPTETQPNITVTATDEGGNANPREFALPIQMATGGSVTNEGGYVIHTFETSDDFVVLGDIPELEYLILAGGAGGGGGTFQANPGGGGGAGGVLTSIVGDTGAGGTAALTTASVTPGTLAVTVGAEGAGAGFAAVGANGGNSSIATIGTAIGGGGGGGGNAGQAPLNGGSGGGVGRPGDSPGTGTAGQGFDGGPRGSTGGQGGSAQQAGIDEASTNTGITTTATGSSQTIADGGRPGGGSTSANKGSGGAGGSGSATTVGQDGVEGLVVVRYK